MKAIILAAGKGSRMKSDRLKVLHEVAGKCVLSYVVDTVETLPVDEIIIVIGHQAEAVEATIKNNKITFVTQHEQKGTGHAVMQVKDAMSIQQKENVLVLAGDCPLIQKSTLESLMAHHQETHADATILTTCMDDPGSYGRILRGEGGHVTGIQEAKDCSQDMLQIKEINTGAYLFDSEQLFEALTHITDKNTQGEYYLTDVIKIINNNGGTISGYCTERKSEAIGINTRQDLGEINTILYAQNNDFWMSNGVTIIDPKTTYIDSTVTIGEDTIIYPCSTITGDTVIGKSCEIGPNIYLTGERVPENSQIKPTLYTIEPKR